MLAEAAQTVDEVVIIDRAHLVAAGARAELTRGGNTLEDVFLEHTEAAS
jgi:hypothetical protein